MPFQKDRYPPDWKSISLRIRERDGQRCKFCGVKNHAYIIRKPDSDEYLVMLEDDGYMTHDGDYISAEDSPSWVTDVKYVRVVLTVAHYPDPDPMNCTDDNLHSLCQKCHNTLDAPMRAKHAAQTRRINKETITGQLRLFEE